MPRRIRQTTMLSVMHQNGALSGAALVVLALLMWALNANVDTNPWGLLWLLNRQMVWAETAIILLLMIGVIGAAINGRFEGVIIDRRNRMSMSKLQAALWTVVVVSALISAASVNLKWNGADHNDLQGSWQAAGQPGDWNVDATDAQHPKARSFGPLEIFVPGELLLAMGIAAASLIGAPIVLENKTNAGANAADLANTANQLNESPSDISADGQVFQRAHVNGASWMDIFRGDEVGNAGTADLSKVQQVLITGLLLSVYCASLWAIFEHHSVIVSLPVVQERFVWLLAISHASYLAYKAAPHSRDSDATGPDARGRPAG